MAETRRMEERRDVVRERTMAALERRRQRAPAERFWAAVALTGSVGWPIVLLAGLGVWLGGLLDSHWGTGVLFRLVLIVLGTSLGTWIGFRAVRGRS